MTHVKRSVIGSAAASVLLFTSQFSAGQRPINARLANKFSSCLGYQLTS